MYEATFELETLTPLFMRGADQSKVEFRSASVKGAMRWWFRALAGNYFGNDITKLREAECRVFGCAGSGRTRRSAVVVEINFPNDIVLEKYPLPLVLWVKREAIPPSTSFRVILKSPKLESLKIASYSLIALSYFGGLGFRSNRGAGSIRINSITTRRVNSITTENFDIEKEIPLPETEKEYKKLPDTLKEKTEANLKQLLGEQFFRGIHSNAWGCPSYSTMKNGCFWVYLWKSKEKPGDIYYRERVDLECPNGNTDSLEISNIALFDAFGSLFKNNNCHHPHASGPDNKKYKNWIFGTSNIRAAAKNRKRRASPMKIGIVKLDGKYYLRISVFKTEPFHPDIEKVYWNNLFCFLEKIGASQKYGTPIRNACPKKNRGGFDGS